ncbi:MAG: hypothetical protein AB8G18_19500 [Gammaproteobacteria bacterium]
MPRARSQLIHPQTTPYYHLVSRCVRRAFLCGKDHATGQSYEHRKDWIEQRLRLLSSIFAIDVCAYAVMSNHYHLVIHINLNESEAWSDDDIAQRWRMLFKGSRLLQRHANNETLDVQETEALNHQIKTLRHRLVSVSWFMKCLNESIARQANRRVTGNLIKVMVLISGDRSTFSYALRTACIGLSNRVKSSFGLKRV